MKYKLLSCTYCLVLLLAAIAGGLAQQQSQQIAPSVERLRQHITYLASDALEGRRTGSRGANDAAHYIAGEFARLGLRPGNLARSKRSRGEALSRYLQTFPYVAGVELGKKNLLSFSVRPEAGAKPVPEGTAASVNFSVGEDWMPLGFSANAQLENLAATFAGYGITAAELNYNDYAGGDLSGRIAIALAGTPDGENPHGQFARYEDVRWKAIAARNAGAKALIVIAGEENFRDNRLSRLRYDNTAGDAGLAVVVVSRAAAVRLLALQDASALSSLEQQIQRTSLHRVAPQAGWTPNMESFALSSPGYVFSLSTDIIRNEVAAANVIGILEGSDPQLKSEAIVIGAHYDHLGRGGEGSLAPGEGDIHYGADDNASGVAGLLELTRVFSLQKPRPRRTIIFIAFSGEEEGLLGSSHYVNHPVMPLANTIAMINMDMIGRMKENKLIVGGVGTAKEWKGLIEDAAPRSAVASTSGNAMVAYGIPAAFAFTLNEDGYGPSDHSSFYAKQIPVLFLWTGTHEDYHKPSDTADKINYADEMRIVSFVERIVRDVDKGLKRPTFTVAKTESSGRTTGFRVYLGTIPNYADSNDGLLLDGVRDDSPAAKAGLKAGDRVVKLAGREVRNVYDYTYALGEMKAGEEYEIEILRGADRLKLKITPAARK